MNPRAAAAAVVVRGLTRRFGDRAAVEDVSLDLRAGEILALLGPNGAGKTTTMRMLAGLLNPTAGTITVCGDALTTAARPSLRRRIGLLTETPGLWERLTVELNLLTYARLYELDDPSGRVRRALARFDLLDRRGDQAATLSKGMKQKVALARALLHEPDVVLLDEPTAGLDPAMARTVRDLVTGLRDDGRAVLISTHNLDEAERVADRIAVLRQRLLALERPDALRQSLFGICVRVELGVDAAPYADVALQATGRPPSIEGRTLRVHVEQPDEHTPSLVRALVQAGAPIRSVVAERAALEDIYLALVDKERS